MVDITTPYASFDDVVKRYNPISTMIGVGTMSVSTDDVSSVYIRDAMSIINAYLSRKYVLPLTPEPILTDLTSDIAIYRILADRAPRIPEFMATRYTNAMSLLIQLQQGNMDLIASSPTTTADGDNYAWSNVADDGRNGPVFRDVESESRVNSADWLTF